MKNSNDCERREGVCTTVEEVWTPGKDDDSVIGDSNYRKYEEDHEISEELEPGA